MAANNVGRQQSRRRGAPAALVMAFVLVACSPVESARVEPARPTASTLEAIQTFGEIGLPAWPEIVDVESDQGADTRYRMVMRLDDRQLEEFLAQFPLGPQPSDIPRSMSVIAGPALDSAPGPLYLQNAIASTDGTFVREIVVDKRATDETYVHIAVYTV